MKLTFSALLLAAYCVFLFGARSNENNYKLTPALSVAIPYHTTVWERIVDKFSFQEHSEQHLVKFYINKYKSNSRHLAKVSESSTPYIYHVISELEKRNLPSELAVLPMIESNYRPRATSITGAAGIWQISKHTGKRYGLKQDGWYDARYDFHASTKAAMNYLEFLYKEFNQDWLLALAAYNSGEGRVKQAIKINQRLNKSTDFWSLPLPKETKHFIPKLLAICHLIRNADQFNITLKYIANKPYRKLSHQDTYSL